jgi:hypothetical protein
MLEQANLVLDILRFQIRLAKDLQCLNVESNGFAAKAIDEIGKQVIRCKPSNVPMFLKEGGTEQFFSRTGAATTELLPSQVQVYIQQRF